MKYFSSVSETAKSSSNRSMRLILLMATTAVTGCVYIDQPDIQTAELYSWNDRQSPLATRNLFVDSTQRQLFSFVNLLHTNPDLVNAEDTPYVVRACDAETCYSSIVFSSDFIRNPRNFLLGTATISALSTTIYNDVSDLPKEAVAAALDALAAKVLIPAERTSPYTDLLRMNIADETVREANMIQPDLEGVALNAIQNDAQYTFTKLLQSVTSDTTDLISTAEFGFSSASRINVDVDVSTRINGPVHLSICNSFENDADGYKVDYASCQLKITLEDGRFTGELELPSTNVPLLVTLLPMKALGRVEYVEWVSSANGTLQVR
ncbi:hypothetical protein EYC98_16715 [Halieaceae bacterium IMCC14734]|uniref:Lipoprotein n=1 Tax=Candidatus Litorirhabdus singularis TaxID=2518993 RepID=A0ABT3TJP5_9GAMM|nr:hypothetical protein [Candidatus Litorirhabdus singularis]MCX2982506.1 hypothetical protein [Candidatus Litorirhabdus singularis]